MTKAARGSNLMVLRITLPALDRVLHQEARPRPHGLVVVLDDGLAVETVELE